ncbi:hypothetical protein [Paenibacillus sp. FSL W7-1287]|uniref:hypothetical protein n=1 Tax=Paenibacillus sp. FSL W7-1287 TaxID=2954538 RepID=UPI0030F630C1
MLTENDVIAAVCNKLENMNFEIRQRLHTSEQGIDIIAVKGNFTLMIEAKGETSALGTSSRYGKPFNRNQIKNHVGKALLAASKLISSYRDSVGYGVAIALPDNYGHRKIIGEIEYALKKLGVYVFWVKDPDTVEFKLN